MSGKIGEDETFIGALAERNEEPGEQQGAGTSAKPQPQHPEVLWIGCSDSRVSESAVFGASPGKVFVHRNIANLVPHGDINSLSVIQYAVEVLGVKRIIVCGHTHCGGVAAALEDKDHGLIDNWLHNIRDVRDRHWKELSKLPSKLRAARLTELNVLAQVENLKRHTNIRNAPGIKIQPWIYDIVTGGVIELPTPKFETRRDTAAEVSELNVDGGH